MSDHARPDRPRLGSLFTGYGGLDAAVEHLFAARTVWRCDNDRAARALIDHHWPSEPNLGDITSIDWSEVEPVDLLTGGFPCQPFSTMGQRSGTGDRRWLWDHILTAVDALQPSLLLFENVTGLLSKPDALAAIIGSLAERGYMGAWRVVAAATAGAPHERRRVVIAAARPQARPLLESAAHPRGDTGHPPLLGSGPAVHEPQPHRARRPARRAHDAPDRWDWSRYGPAIRRWEALLGRPAPHPVEWRLNRPQPRTVFLEWMMGLAAGHVTGVPGLTWGQQCRLLGNGVVPQQATLAFRQLTRDLLDLCTCRWKP